MEWRVSLVFDGRGDVLTVERPFEVASYVVATSPASATADDIIEQWVGAATDPSEWVVATADRALQSTVIALGAEVISPRELAAWVARAEEREHRAVKRFRDTENLK